MALHYGVATSRRLLSATEISVAVTHAPVTGQIAAVYAYLTGGTNNTNGDFTFDANIDGTSIWNADQTQRLKVLSGQYSGSKTGLSAAVTLGQRISVDLDVAQSGGIGNPISFIFVFDDLGIGTDPSPAFVTLTDAATVNWAFSANKIQNGIVTLGGNRQLAMTGLVNGSSGVLLVKQPLSGGPFTLALPSTGGLTSKVINNGAGVISYSTTAGAIDALSFITYDGVNLLWTYGNRYS